MSYNTKLSFYLVWNFYVQGADVKFHVRQHNQHKSFMLYNTKLLRQQVYLEVLCYNFFYSFYVTML
jgi:hypothetical protein